MASFSFKDGTLTLNAVDLSSYTRNISISTEVEDLEDTAMGDDWRSRIGGLKEFTLDLEFNADFDSSAIDDTIWPLLGTVTTFAIKPTSASTSATNPEYSGSVLVTEYTPLDGSVGDLATVSVSWPGATALSRATS